MGAARGWDVLDGRAIEPGDNSGWRRATFKGPLGFSTTGGDDTDDRLGSLSLTPPGMAMFNDTDFPTRSMTVSPRSFWAMAPEGSTMTTPWEGSRGV